MIIKLLKKQKSRGFTLVEIIIIVVVIAILAALASVYYWKTVSKSEDSEALLNLGAIRKSELAKHDETGTFVNAVDTQDVNEKLPASEVQEKIFRYKVINATMDDFVAIAERIKGRGNLTTDLNAEEPIVIAMYADGSVNYGASGGGYGQGAGVGAGAGSSGSGGGGSGGGGGSSGGTGGSGSSGGASGGSSGGASGGSSGGTSGGTGSGSSYGGASQVVDVDLANVLELLRISTAGNFVYNLVQQDRISLVYQSILEPDPGYITLGYWYAPENKIVINELLKSAWTDAAIATIVAHEGTHADYSYNPQKWIDLTLARHPELTAGDLHITAYPYNSVDQEYNANFNEVAVWKELKGSQTNSVPDSKEAMMDQGEAFYKSYLKSIPAYAILPDY